MDISQSAYSQYEKSQKLRKATWIKIAEALQIKPELLDF
ncbi:helix-turn-helix domain-containing protein [Gilliamella sp. App2-1]